MPTLTASDSAPIGLGKLMWARFGNGHGCVLDFPIERVAFIWVGWHFVVTRGVGAVPSFPTPFSCCHRYKTT